MSKLTDNQLAQLYVEVQSYREHTRFTNKQLVDHLTSLAAVSLTNDKSRMNHLAKNELVNIQKAIKIIIASMPEPALLLTDNPKSTFNWKSKSNKEAINYLDPRRVVYMMLLIVISLLTAGTLLALYTLLNESLNSMERFIYNEGWLEAFISIASMLAGACLGGLVGVFLGAMPLIMLGFTLGLTNPVVVAIAGIVCFSIIGAALVNVVANWLHGKSQEKANHDSLDPTDPYRYRLTDNEEKRLIDKKIDPLKVKCAMAAIREKIGPVLPSLLNRLFVNHEQQAYLKLVRRLRRGELKQVEVGNLKFSLSEDGPDTAERQETVIRFPAGAA